MPSAHLAWHLAPNCFSEAGRAITLTRIVLTINSPLTPPHWNVGNVMYWRRRVAARLKVIVHEAHQACAQLDPGEHLYFSGYPHEPNTPLERID
jgi:hypothetical protein